MRRSTSPANCSVKSATTRKSPPPQFDGYADPEATRRENPARRLRPGDVWFRTGDLLAATRAAISISSTASATPFAGRARTSRRPRSPRRSRPFPACSRRPSTASPCRATRAAPAWRRWWSTSRDFDLAGLRAPSPSACRPTRGRCSCASGRARPHRHFQAEQGRAGRRGLRPANAAATRSISTIGAPGAYARVDADFVAAVKAGAVGAVTNAADGYLLPK